MQLIAEAYHLMTDGLGLSHSEMASIFADWNQGELDSFLVEITANILKFKDDDGMPLVGYIIAIFLGFTTAYYHKCLHNSKGQFKYVLFLCQMQQVTKIRDTAGQKGTGKWTAISALDHGMPVTLIAESVFARCLSSLKVKFK